MPDESFNEIKLLPIKAMCPPPDLIVAKHALMLQTQVYVLRRRASSRHNKRPLLRVRASVLRVQGLIKPKQAQAQR